MDTFKKVVYDDHKRILDLIADDLYGDSKEAKKEFLDKYLKKNYSYFQPCMDDIKPFHKKRIKNALK
jgi:hypothetical protein